MDDEFKIPPELIKGIMELQERAKEGYDSWLKNSLSLDSNKTLDLLKNPESVFTMGWIDGYVARQWEDQPLEESRQ